MACGLRNSHRSQLTCKRASRSSDTFLDGVDHHDGLAAMKAEMRLSYSRLCRVLLRTWPTLDVVKAVPGLEWRKQVLTLFPMEELAPVMSADNLLKAAILENDLGL